MINRRDFTRTFGYGLAGFVASSFLRQQSYEAKAVTSYSASILKQMNFSKLPSPDYYDVSHSKVDWKSVSKGLEFSRVDVYRGKELVDVIAALKIDPNHNVIRVFNGYNSPGNTELHTLEGWQRKTGAIAMINSAQYMADPPYMPCALVICDGKQKGPRYNKSVRGMLVAEPARDLEGKLSKADLLDFDYDSFDFSSTPYLQGVQHWPILLDREGRIKVGKSLWQANRTVVAKANDESMLFMTTEGGYFTLFNLARFLKESNQGRDSGFDVHTVMNMDGGYEADMVVKTPDFSYVTYGEFETYGPGKDATIFGIKIKIPGVLGVFQRC